MVALLTACKRSNLSHASHILRPWAWVIMLVMKVFLTVEFKIHIFKQFWRFGGFLVTLGNQNSSSGNSVILPLMHHAILWCPLVFSAESCFLPWTGRGKWSGNLFCQPNPLKQSGSQKRKVREHHETYVSSTLWALEPSLTRYNPTKHTKVLDRKPTNMVYSYCM